MEKSKKIEKTEELMAGYQEAEYIWNVLWSVCQRETLTKNGLKETQARSLKLFWKQPFRVV